MTRRDNEDYFDFVRRSGAHQLAKPVKLADLQDNFRAVVEHGLPEEADKYVRALEILEAN